MAVLVYHVAATSRQEACAAQRRPMMKSRMFPLISTLFCLLTVVPAQPRSSDTPQNLRATIPAGYQIVRLQPSGEVLSLLGLVECAEIAGAQQVSHGLD